MLFFLLLSLGLSPDSFAASEPVVFRARLSEDMGTLDWNYGEINPEIAYQLMEGLFRADGKGQPVLGVARSYRWNDKKTEMTVNLKPDRRWSDGSPVCAQQFVDSWSRLLNKTFASPYAHYAHPLKKFEAKSCRELRITFERPTPEAPALLSHYVFFPLRADQLKASPKIFNEGSGLQVNGPFFVKEWKKNQQVVLEKNPSFGGKQPVIKRVEFYFIPDESTAQVMYEQKRLDWVKDVPQLLRTPAMEKSPAFREFPQLTTFYLGVHSGKSELLQDPEVRRALNESLDRSQLPKILGREHRGTRTWLSPVIFPELEKLKPNQKWESAKKKLKAGPMDLKLVVYAKAAHKTMAEWAQGQWEKNLGVRIPIEVQEAKVYWREIYVNTPPIFLSGVTAPYGHPRAFLQEFLSTSTANWTGWSSTDYDLAVNEERFQDAENILQGSGVIIPLYTRDTIAIVAPRWKGFHINPLGQMFLNELSL